MSMLTPEQDARVKKSYEGRTYPPEYEMKRGMRKVVWVVVRFLMRLFRVETIGAEHIPAEGPALLCANHRSFLDIPLIHLTINRWTWWVARESLFRFRFTSHFIPWWGGVPLDVKNPSPSSVKLIMQHLRDGKMLGIFPQGTRCGNIEKSKKTPPKSGAISFAIRNDAYIIPAAVDGEFKLFRKTRLIIGEPYKIDTKGKKRLSDRELRIHALDLMDRIFALMDKEYPLENRESYIETGEI